MKLLVLIISMAIAIQSFGQYDDFFVDQATHIAYSKSDSTPYTGVYTKYYRKGNKKFESVFKDGKMKTSCFWHKNGRLRDSAFYQDDYETFKQMFYQENGKLKKIINTKVNKIEIPLICGIDPIGINQYYDLDGNKYEERNYLNDSVTVYRKYDRNILKSELLWTRGDKVKTFEEKYFRIDGTVEKIERTKRTFWRGEFSHIIELYDLKENLIEVINYK